VTQAAVAVHVPHAASGTCGLLANRSQGYGIALRCRTFANAVRKRLISLEKIEKKKW